MTTIREYLLHPAMLAMIDFAAQNSEVIVGWHDGGEILVQLDSFLPADETHDGSEQADIKVVEVLHSAKSVDLYKQGAHNEISTLVNPPSYVASPDRVKAWRK